MILGKRQCNKVKLKINSIIINESDTVELLGILIDNIPTFSEHINNLCRMVSYKLYTLCRIRKYLKVHSCRFGNFLTYSNSFKDYTWKISHS